MKNKKVLAIIPARGGSKRILRKNIKNFLGHPIIKYSLEAAIQSKCFDEVMVSTDDEQIAKSAVKYGGKVPFLRSAKNSDDNATTSDVIYEVLKEYEKRSEFFEVLCCIYPTAPLISAVSLKKGLELLKTGGYDSVVPIVKYGHPIQRALEKYGAKIKMVWQTETSKRSQDLPERYHDAGQFYWIRTEPFLKNKVIFGKNTGGITLNDIQVQDIDNLDDWNLAELKYKLLKG